MAGGTRRMTWRAWSTPLFGDGVAMRFHAMTALCACSQQSIQLNYAVSEKEEF
jgi:hypothetical protein